MKKSLLAIIATLILLVSCRSEEDKGRDMWKAYLNKVLVAPQTVNIISETSRRANEGSSCVLWKIEYSCETGGGNNVILTLNCKTWLDSFEDYDRGVELTREELKPYMK